MLRAIKYEIRPTKVQSEAIRKACGCARFVFNKALALKIEKYQQDKVNLSQYDLDKLLTSWKKEFTFLSDCPSQALQQKVHDMCGAFGKMKNGAKYTDIVCGEGFSKTEFFVNTYMSEKSVGNTTRIPSVFR